MNQKSKNAFVLIDGSSYLFRAYHALPPLNNSQGQPTGAIYGVINMLRKLIKDYRPKYIAMIFDAKGETFRHRLYPNYKAHRPDMPEELASQIPPLHDIIRAMGIPLLIADDVEADDVIGTLATRAQQENLYTLISTGDKDMAQLVNEQVHLINTMSNTFYDREGVIKKFGIPPELIIDYLTLMGDTVDNIPGVKNVGPKTAVKWLTTYGSLQGVIDNADNISGKVGENLRQHVEHFPITQSLTTIKCDLTLPYPPSALMPTPPDTAALKNLFQKLEFKSWLAELEEQDESVLPGVVKPERNYHTVLSQKDFHLWINKIKQSRYFAIDTETTGLNYITAELVGLSLAVTAGEACYIPLAHRYLDAPKQLDRDSVLAELKPLLESPNHLKIGQNLKYDKHILANYGIELRGIEFDTLLESYVLNSVASRHDMDSLAMHYLGKETIHYEDVAGKGSKQKTFDAVPLEEAAPYACEDADITLQLHHALWPQLAAKPDLKFIYHAIEKPLLPILAEIEYHGVLIDKDMLLAQSEEISIRLNELEQEAFGLAGDHFNLNSPKQLQAILFEQMQLPIIEKTPKGAPSTSENVLHELALNYPLPKVIIEHRSLSKLKSTYTDRLPEQISMKTGRVHTSYHQAIAATGRLSSSDPNLQNIPIRTEQGRRVRQAFIAPKGCVILAADYSQIELRIMAHLSQDKTLQSAFSHGLDVHRATAAEVFGVEFAAVSPDQRRSAKAINFGLIYGMSAFGLAKQLGIERKEAEAYVELYFQRYPGVKAYMDNARQLAHDHGFVTTCFGRRLYLPEINAKAIPRQKAAERTAINAPMQGTAADIIKLAMIHTQQRLQQEKHHTQMIMQVHDELVFEVPENEIEQAKRLIQETMTEAAKLSVNLEVAIGIGPNWDQAH